MALPPAHTQQDASFENWDKKAEQIQGEETQRLSEIEDAFRKSPEYEKLSSIVQDKKILETIVTNYANTDGNLKEAIQSTFTDPVSAKRLGLTFESSQDAQATADALMELASIERESEVEGEEETTPTQENSEEEVMLAEANEVQEIHTEEIPGFPTLQKLKQNDIISTEHFEGIQNKLTNGETMEDSITSIIFDADKRENILSFFKQKNPEQRKEEFFKNMPDEIAKDKDNPIVQLIAENYVEIPGKDKTKPSQEEDFKIAIQEAANTTINGKTFPRTEGFELAMKTIQRGNDKKDMFVALGEIYHYVNNYTGVRGKNSIQKQRLAQKANAQKVELKEITFAELIATAKKNADTKQQERIQQVMAAQNAEKNDTVEKGEGGMGGDVLDMLSEIQTDSPKKAV